MENKTVINIVYDGIEYTEGTIDIKEFAPSLLAFGELIEEANTLINQKQCSIHTRITTNSKKKCFQIELVLYTKLLEKTMSLFGITHYDNALEILKTIGIIPSDHPVVAGGIALITSYIAYKKWLKNRKPTKVTKLQNGNTLIEVEEEKRELSAKVGVLEFKKSNFKQKFSKHIDINGTISYVDKNNPKKITIDENDKQYYIDNILEDENKETKEEKNEIKGTIELITPNFDGGDYKWRFKDVDYVFLADIKDQDFLNKVDNRTVTFGKGDFFEVTRQEIKILFNDEKPKKEHTILKVHKIIDKYPLFSNNGDIEE